MTFIGCSIGNVKLYVKNSIHKNWQERQERNTLLNVDFCTDIILIGGKLWYCWTCFTISEGLNTASLNCNRHCDILIYEIDFHFPIPHFISMCVSERHLIRSNNILKDLSKQNISISNNFRNESSWVFSHIISRWFATLEFANSFFEMIPISHPDPPSPTISLPEQGWAWDIPQIPPIPQVP